MRLPAFAELKIRLAKNIDSHHYSKFHYNMTFSCHYKPSKRKSYNLYTPPAGGKKYSQANIYPEQNIY